MTYSLENARLWFQIQQSDASEIKVGREVFDSTTKGMVESAGTVAGSGISANANQASVTKINQAIVNTGQIIKPIHIICTKADFIIEQYFTPDVQVINFTDKKPQHTAYEKVERRKVHQNDDENSGIFVMVDEVVEQTVVDGFGNVHHTKFKGD